MRTRLPVIFTVLLALSVPTLGQTAPGDGPPAERFEEGRHRGGRGAARNEERFLDGLAMKDPERHRKVVEIRTSRPLMYRTLLRQSGQELRLRNKDPDSWSRLYQLIDTTYVLKGQLDAYETASGKARKTLAADIETTVGELFELRQANRRAQVALMEARLEKLRSDIEQRDANKDEVVGTFTERMLRAMDEGRR